MLRPPPIPGVEDWGIPPETTEKCEPALQTKFAKFSSLKLDRSKPMHFNDSLMSNRSFRNPHLYTHLVDWVDVDERTTNFPKSMWDPDDVKPDWYANQIADAQKERSEKQSAAQASGKRSHIEFSSSASSSRDGHSHHRDGGGQLPTGPRKSRFGPYSTSSSSATAGRERQKTRWG
ncbi:HCNGP-domain-containing protein [Agrocybe pediades]|nr:HCNGP-domain-containing protein [Agrocybe pediades]